MSLEVPETFINTVLESNGLITESTLVDSQISKENLTEEAEMTIDEVLDFFAETYDLELTEDTLPFIFEFAEEFGEVLTESLNEAEEGGSEEIDIDLDVVTKVLAEDYNVEVDTKVAASLVEFAHDFLQA
jgi:hypothetical protein